MRIAVRHITRYVYADPAAYFIQSLRLTPRSFAGQQVRDWRIVMPGMERAVTCTDCFGNTTHLVTSQAPHQELVIEAAGQIDTQDRGGVVGVLSESAPPRIYLRETRQTKAQTGICKLAAAVGSKADLERLHELSACVRERVDYVLGATDAHTSAEEALASGKGVCQDHAHVFISAARVLGIPARYVTGYLLTEVASQEVAHHAWAECWVESLGWLGFDVANRICPTERYVRLACGLDASSAAPVRGTRRGGGAESLEIAVEVQLAAQQ